MIEYKFTAGQTVELHFPKGSHQAPGPFSVVRRLPFDGRENQYRLKSNSDGHERVAVESDLSTRVA